ncbi:MAG: hypothetical protein J5643_08275 [Lachnospiraceae bacterium]|nr:hypothetical protein [Lachnospiraceae bacterium]
MRGRIFQKNALKDYFSRTYAVALVLIAFLLFLDVMMFILSRGVLQSGEGETHTIQYFSFMGGNLFMAMLFPAIMLYMLLGGCFDRGAGDLYQSLPPARSGMFLSAVCVISGYEGVFLLLQMVSRKVLIATTEGFRVRKYFYISTAGFSMAVFTLFLAVAILCFCAASSAFEFFGRLVLWAFLIDLASEGINSLLDLKQIVYYSKEVNVSGTITVKLGNFRSLLTGRFLFDEYEIDRYEAAWEMNMARDVGLFLAVFGAALLLAAWFFFKKRPAERTNGRNRSELMHVSLQAVAFFGIMLSSGLFVDDYRYMRLYYLIRESGWQEVVLPVLKKSVTVFLPLAVFLAVWELLYRKKFREVPKIWKGILAGVILCLVGGAIVLLY